LWLNVKKIIKFEFFATDMKTEGTTNKKAAGIEEKKENLKQAQSSTGA